MLFEHNAYVYLKFVLPIGIPYRQKPGASE